MFRVLLVLMSHLSFITTTAVTEDDGEEFGLLVSTTFWCNLIASLVRKSMSANGQRNKNPPLSRRFPADSDIFGSAPVHPPRPADGSSADPWSDAAGQGTSLWVPPLLPDRLQATAFLRFQPPQRLYYTMEISIYNMFQSNATT